MPNLVQPVTDASFQADVLQASATSPVMVDFWASWCGACKNVAPVLEQLAATYQGKMRIVKINVEENPATAATYELRGLPTLIIFKNGQPVDKLSGARPKSPLIELIEKNL